MRHTHPEVQDRFAAYMLSRGVEVTPANAASLLANGQHWRYCRFISEMKRAAADAGRGVIWRHSRYSSPEAEIRDHDEFTAFCFEQVKQ